MPLLRRVSHVQQNLEVQLLATIGKIQRGHLRRIASFLGALEGFAVHLFQIGQDSFTGSRHTEALEGFDGESGGHVVGRGHALLCVEESRELIKEHAPSAIRDVHESWGGWQGATRMKRLEIFARDGYRCVYCGNVFAPDDLSVDHVQPKMRGGDASLGNVVTACRGCNTAKGGQRLSTFLAGNATARRNFFRFARYLWSRHKRAVAEELARQGVVERSEDFVEGVRLLRGSEATVSLTQPDDPDAT